MRALLVLLPCAACNSLLGLDKTTEKPIDAPIDAPLYACRMLRSLSAMTKAIANCTDYTTDSGHATRAVALCGTATKVISEGNPGDTSLMPVTFSEPPTSPHDAPRLAASGELMVVRTATGSLLMPVFFSLMGRTPSNTWSQSAQLFFDDLGPNALITTDTIGTPTGGDGSLHLMLHHHNGPTSEFHEYVEGVTLTATWTMQHTYTADHFMLKDIAEPNLSEDGLGLLFIGTDMASTNHIYISSRPDLLASTFDRADPITLPMSVDAHAPFLTGDCSQLYLTAASDTNLATP